MNQEEVVEPVQEPLNNEENQAVEGIDWRPFHDGTYRVYKNGTIQRVLPTKSYFIRGCIDTAGYRFFQIYQGTCKRKNVYFHNVVARLFHGERPAGLVIDHINRNPMDNRADNLRYVTPQENARNTARFRADVQLEGQERARYLAKQLRLRNLERYRAYARKYALKRKQLINNALEPINEIEQNAEQIPV